MGKFVLDDAIVMLGGRDLSGELNSISLEYSAELPDSTAFGDTTRTRLPGVLDVVASHTGWWDSVDASDSLDADLFAEIGAAEDLMSFSPDGGQLGEVGFSFPMLGAAYSPGASHGEVFAFSLSVNGTGPLVRGKVMEKTVFTVTGGGTTRQLGAVASTDTLYSIIHVTALSGTDTPTITVTLESDAADTFGGAETTRLSHPAMTAVGANLQSADGAITDEWWRLLITISGTDPSFTLFGVVGIQPTTLP